MFLKLLIRFLLGLCFVSLFACGGGGGNTTSYIITASAGAGGSINPASTTVISGATASFTVTPDSGNSINTVTGCAGALAGTTYTTGAVTADCTVTASFVSNGLPTISIADASGSEGDSGTTNLDFTITLSAPASGSVNVDYATSDGSAAAGSDYTAISNGTLTISAGNTSGTVTVTVTGDTMFEANEIFTLTLSNPTGATLGTVAATGTINNDDPVSVLPTITSFTSDVVIISAGSSVNLAAVFTNGTGNINNGVGAVTSGAPILITPAATTTYTLTVSGATGVVTSTITVNVVALPAISGFTANAATIPAGASVNLSAVFANGAGAVDNAVGSVTSGAAVSVAPTSSTTYILTVTNAAGDTVTSAITVEVIGLNTLSVTGGALDQVFQPGQLGYTATVGFVAASAIVTAATGNAGATITVNGVPIGAGNTSQSIALVDGLNPAITIVVTAVDSTTITYTLTITRQLAAAFAQQAYIKASSTDIYVRKFGYSVALSGDTLVVGAPNEDGSSTGINGNETTDLTNGGESGAVYVFTRSGTTWLQQAYIKASNTERMDQFGVSVALFGDTLAVGAAWEDSAATGVNGDQLDNTAFQSGAVYIFTRSGSTWSQQAYIKASNPGGGSGAISTGDLFGETIALSGDTLVVGASREDSVATGVGGDQADNSADWAGAVYVFTRSGSTWSQQAYIKASNTTAYDLFGKRVTLSGDTLAAGAKGGTYVFIRNGTIWSQQVYLAASSGDSVSLSGNTLAIGANSASGSVLISGAVYVYTRSGTAWSQQAFLEASNADIGDFFGDNVALSGDTLVVGAYLEASKSVGVNGDQADNSALGSGAAYVFTRSGTTWSQQAYLKASNAEAGDGFGGDNIAGFNVSNVAISGGTIAIGASQEDSASTGVNGGQADNSAQWAGAVYVFK